eukprot:TRINITY_DN11956_c0_g1_i1.p3 TRINITY_DN11956_c0_g1~~TRINITY_DN11956_c0_g1_i1.p3  ORF type:complete len:150 (+),score=33.14 TRINITY_DN11956_c0_g1_i1:266-715(+)
MEESEATARRNAIRQIDRLVAKLRTTGAKGSVLFDIISTRKHIATQIPHRLGAALYRYVEDTYFDDVSTTFVGLTDNTARRVARDVFCQNKELSRQKYSFEVVDDVHMFVVYPPRIGDDALPDMGTATDIDPSQAMSPTFDSSPLSPDY